VDKKDRKEEIKESTNKKQIPPGHGCLYFVCLCRCRRLRMADHPSRGVVLSVSVSLCVITCKINTLNLEWLGRKRFD
jgi:hypothetical protein